MNKNKLWIYFVVVGILFIIILSFGLLVLEVSPNLQVIHKVEKTPSAWTLKLLTNPTCRLPCWENIIPGKTLIETAPTLLDSVEGAKIITYPTIAEGSNIIQMQWSLDSNSSTPDYADANGLSSDGVIYTIVLGIGDSKNLQIEDVIKSYGAPEYMQVYSCNAKLCLFRLIYPNLGMVLEVPLKDRGDKAIIDSSSRVRNIVLIPDGVDSYENHLIGRGSMNLSTPLVKWKGYGQYDYMGNYKP